MKFIEVTSKNQENERHLINIAHIEHVTEGKTLGRCTLFLTTGKKHNEINESYNEVKEMIQEATR